MASAATSMFCKYINGAIGAFDKQKAAQDRASEPDSTKEGEYVTKTEVRNLVNRSIKGQTPAQPKQNKASEAQAAQKDVIESSKKPSKKEILENAQKNFGANRSKWARTSSTTASFM